ncbi:MAG: hypothetical protein H7338_23675 [Candidatus Sericytochromatia bacterium]|nr:hypothetical protein [Candidatus Sericytochromatia bacterium]
MIKRMHQWSGALLAVGITLLAACGPMPVASPSGSVGLSRAASSAPTQTLLVMPDAGPSGILAAIDAAKRTIDVEVYMLSDGGICDALTRAAKRGVQVRALLEPQPYNPGDPNKPIPTNSVTRKKMADSGVVFRWTNKESFTYTHQKSFVVDGAVAFIMTMNLSKAAMLDNREFIIIEKDPQRVKLVQQLFDADWSYTPFDAKNLGSLVLSPVNSRSQLTSLIESAQRTLVMEIEVFFDPAIFDLLAKKMKQGVVISVLLPSPKKIDFGLQTVAELRKRGVTNVRFIQAPMIHAKLIVADGARAYIGSINPTTNSMDNNRELGIILDEPGIVSKLVQVNVADWSKGEDFPATIQTRGRTVTKAPIDFEPIF